MPTIKIIDKRPEKKIKVAAYCRVSTSDADQLASLDNQKKHYEELIKAHSEWAFVGVYSDDGISGRSINGRDGFKKLISDALTGKIDFILTKRRRLGLIQRHRAVEGLKPLDIWD